VVPLCENLGGHDVAFVAYSANATFRFRLIFWSANGNDWADYRSCGFRLKTSRDPGPCEGRNVIALTSGLHEPVIDPPSPSWLGLYSGRDKVRRSGLWNQRHVDENYVPKFFDVLEAAIERNADHSAIA
jgi:hypothetical protein